MSHRSSGATTTLAPTIVIAPGGGALQPSLRELWAHRELGYFLVWRDLKVRYRQTVFGVLWAVIQPLALMVVFSLFLGRIPGLAPGGIPYPAFVLAALVPWTLFARSVAGAADSVVGASNLIQKVYFPRMLLPISAMGSHLIDFLISAALLVLLLVGFGLIPGLSALWIVPMTLLIVLASLAVGVWLAAAYVRYRDIRQVVPLLIQLWLFASPVAYSSSIVPTEWHWAYFLNPMAGAIEGFRWALLGAGTAAPIAPVLVAGVVSAIGLAIALVYFRRFERTFADVI